MYNILVAFDRFGHGQAFPSDLVVAANIGMMYSNCSPVIGLALATDVLRTFSSHQRFLMKGSRPLLYTRQIIISTEATILQLRYETIERIAWPHRKENIASHPFFPNTENFVISSRQNSGPTKHGQQGHEIAGCH